MASLESSPRPASARAHQHTILPGGPTSEQSKAGCSLPGVPPALRSEASEPAWARKETLELGRQEVTHWLKGQARQFPTGSRTK